MFDFDPYNDASPLPVIFNRNADDDEVYARKRNSDEYYPDTGQIAKDRSEYNLYAKDRNGLPIYPTDGKGDEHYLRFGGEGPDAEDDFLTDDHIFYARASDGSESYPKLKHIDGGWHEFQIGHRYAKRADGKSFYPVDSRGHEFHIPESKSQSPEEYPISSDGRYIVRHSFERDEPVFDDTLKPKLSESDLVGIIRVTARNSRYHLTNVRAGRKPRSTGDREYTIYNSEMSPIGKGNVRNSAKSNVMNWIVLTISLLLMFFGLIVWKR